MKRIINVVIENFKEDPIGTAADFVLIIAGGFIVYFGILLIL